MGSSHIACRVSGARLSPFASAWRAVANVSTFGITPITRISDLAVRLGPSGEAPDLYGLGKQPWRVQWEAISTGRTLSGPRRCCNFDPGGVSAGGGFGCQRTANDGG